MFREHPARANLALLIRKMDGRCLRIEVGREIAEPENAIRVLDGFDNTWQGSNTSITAAVEWILLVHRTFSQNGCEERYFKRVNETTHEFLPASSSRAAIDHDDGTLCRLEILNDLLDHLSFDVRVILRQCRGDLLLKVGYGNLRIRDIFCDPDTRRRELSSHSET